MRDASDILIEVPAWLNFNNPELLDAEGIPD